MMKRIWSSLPLDLLRKEVLDAGISKDDFLLFDKPEDMTQAEIFFGSLPQDGEAGEQLSKMAACWIQLESVDYNYLTFGEKKNVIVTNMKGVFSRVVAESVIGSLLAFYRGLWACCDAHQSKQWQRWPIRHGLDNLTRKTVVLLGGGAIAEEIIKLLEPFQCSVIVYRRENLPMGEAVIINSHEQLSKHLKGADAVIDTLPASSETEGFLSRELLENLSPEALVMNVGRGVTLDEEALITMLKVQRIRAAILDVTREEPIAPESPYWDVPNLYLTQHTAGGHKDEMAIKCKFFIENLKLYLSNQPLKNRIVL